MINLLTGCASEEVSDKSEVEVAYAKAEKLEKDERFEEAIQRFQDIKNRFPYSKLAIQSELKIADIQFARESFIEAQAAYQIFKELHPKHSQIDYVTFRIGLSYFNQLPDTIDRDLSVAERAVATFDEVIAKFPDSSFIKEAREKRTAALKMLAEKELYIADFYFKQEKFESALKRYEALLKNFSEDPSTDKALFGGFVSALETGDREKGKKFLSRLSKEFPSSDFYEKAKQRASKYGL